MLGLSPQQTFRLGADDYRTRWLADLGFTVPATSAEVSLEKLSVLDKDVLLVEGMSQEALDNPLMKQLAVAKDGRLVNLGQFDQNFAGAVGFNSPLSIPYVLENAIPRLVAVTDGNPATRPAPME